MALVLFETRLTSSSRETCRWRSYRRWVVRNPHVADALGFLDPSLVEPTALQDVRDLTSHRALLLDGNVEPLKQVGHQPVTAIALVFEVMLAGEALLDLLQDHVLER